MQNVQASEIFIGRSKELDIFMQWLDDPQARRILYFRDALEEPTKKGGIGKTSLLKKCQELARKHCPDLAIASIDFFNVGDRNGVVVAERIVKALQDAFPDWPPTTFSEAIEGYRSANKLDDAEGTEARNILFNALTTDLRHLDRQLARKQKTLLVFYDTYEAIEQNTALATLRFSQKFPDTYLFERMYAVVAGRNALDWTALNWKGREWELQTITLAPFSQPEMLQYLDAESFYSIDAHSPQAEALHERTEGRPILIGLVADVLNKHIVTLEELTAIPQQEFEPHLVTQINNLERPLNWIVLFMAHAYHRFNTEILDWLLREADLKRLVQNVQFAKLVDSLPTLSFVRRSGIGEDFVLHDEMRRLVNAYCWPRQDRNFRHRTTISRKIVEYYDHVLDEELDQQKRQNYRLEVLFHKLFLDVDDGLQYFDTHFNRAIVRGQTSFARTFLQEALRFDDRLSADQRNFLLLAQGKLLRTEDSPTEALDIYQTLELQAGEQWINDHRLDLLHGKGRCYLALSRFLDTIDSFNQCLEVEKAIAKDAAEKAAVAKEIAEKAAAAQESDAAEKAAVAKDAAEKADEEESAVANRLSQLGYVHRRRGQFEVAVRFYEESIAMLKRLNNQRAYANVLNSIGNIYKLQGKMDEALLRCKIALRLRNDLLKEDKIGEISVGLTHSTIGQIYFDMDDISNAEKSFKQAYEIYNRARDKRSIGATMNRFGQIAMARSNWAEAKRWFEQAQEASANIDSEAYLISLNKQGRILAKHGHWADAARFFEQAVDLARQVHDDYQRTENLVDLAEALEYMDQRQQALQLLQEAEQISHRWNYFHLLGHAAEFQGDREYNTGCYENAFAYYKEYCYYMAQRNALEYGKARRKLTDQLVGVPSGQLHPIVDSLIAYWYEQKMDEKHPDFVDACKEVNGSL